MSIETSDEGRNPNFAQEAFAGACVGVIIGILVLLIYVLLGAPTMHDDAPPRGDSTTQPKGNP